MEHQWTPENGLLDPLKTSFAYAPHKYDRSGLQRGVTSARQAYTTGDLLGYSEDFYELDLQATKGFATGALSHELTFGFDGDYSTQDYVRRDRTTNLVTGAVTEARAGASTSPMRKPAGRTSIFRTRSACLMASWS
ncbi:hypothetical protein V6L77_00340 [Pannonibacter sp. Pt2-lr]